MEEADVCGGGREYNCTLSPQTLERKTCTALQEKCENEAFPTCRQRSPGITLGIGSAVQRDRHRGGGYRAKRTPNKINPTERLYVKNITIADTINFSAQEGSNYLESIWEAGHAHETRTG